MAIFSLLLSSAGVNNMSDSLKMVSLAALVISLFWLIMRLKNYQKRTSDVSAAILSRRQTIGLTPRTAILMT